MANDRFSVSVLFGPPLAVRVAMDGLDSLRISDEKKKYIVDLLNPVLEEMVAECIHRMPQDPVPFMLEYLEQKRIKEEEKDLTVEERGRLLEENEKLQTQVDKVKSQMQAAVKMAATSEEKHDHEEEEEEDDDDDEPPEGFEIIQSTKSRTSVSAEAYGEWNTKKAFVPPVITKTDEQKDRLKSCLGESFLFSSLDETEIAIIIGAMQEVKTDASKRIINQGDQGDFLFVIESGTLDCFIKNKNDDGETKVYTYKSGEVFGEIALLYNCPRQASIVSGDACVLWQLDRDTFNHIVKEAAEKKRKRYDVFLSKVPLLQAMDPTERSQLADALKVEAYEANQTIVTQGEPGKKFYIIEEGEAEAKKGGIVVMSYKGGDYFGELALIRNQPRAATITCKTACKMLSVDSNSFKRLLNVNDLLERSNQYT